MAAVKAGGDRQELHEVIREHSLNAWAARSRGEPNPLAHTLPEDPRVTALASPATVRSWLDASDYTGDAAVRARRISDNLRQLCTLPEPSC